MIGATLISSTLLRSGVMLGPVSGSPEKRVAEIMRKIERLGR